MNKKTVFHIIFIISVLVVAIGAGYQYASTYIAPHSKEVFAKRAIQSIQDHDNSKQAMRSAAVTAINNTQNDTAVAIDKSDTMGVAVYHGSDTARVVVGPVEDGPVGWQFLYGKLYNNKVIVQLADNKNGTWQTKQVQYTTAPTPVSPASFLLVLLAPAFSLFVAIVAGAILYILLFWNGIFRYPYLMVGIEKKAILRFICLFFGLGIVYWLGNRHPGSPSLISYIFLIANVYLLLSSALFFACLPHTEKKLSDGHKLTPDSIKPVANNWYRVVNNNNVSYYWAPSMKSGQFVLHRVGNVLIGVDENHIHHRIGVQAEPPESIDPQRAAALL